MKITVKIYEYDEVKDKTTNLGPIVLERNVDCATLKEAAKVAVDSHLNFYCENYGGTKVLVDGRLIFQGFCLHVSAVFRDDLDFYDAEFEKLYWEELQAHYSRIRIAQK